MTNSTKTTRYSTIFLAAILVTGTITAFFPSFMVGTAQAVPYPDIDREKKEDKKSVSVSSLKCNNINVNVNGLELNVLPSFLDGGEIAAEAVEPNTDANSFAADNNGDGSQINDFRFICINNNNNTVTSAGNDTISTPPVDPCEECFTQNIDAIPLAAYKEALRGGIGVVVDPGLPSVEIHSLAELCALIEANPSEIADILRDATVGLELNPAQLEELVICIATALDIPIPPF